MLRLLVLSSFVGSLAFELLGVYPRRQWDNAQGYCGETSIQTSALLTGAWISQTVVRTAGGTGSQILICNEKGCNAATALTKLGLAFDMFQDNSVPTPQPTAFFSFVRDHIDAGHVAIMCVYVNGATDSDYDHIVPVVGYDITSSGSPKDLLFFDLEESTPDKCRFNVTWSTFVKSRAACNAGKDPYCLPDKVDYAVSVTGPADPNHELAPGVQVNVLVANWDEPNVSKLINPDNPITMFANLSLSGLAPGDYSLLRYDRVSPPIKAFSCASADVCTNFSASERNLLIEDHKGFLSNTAVHWRVIPRA
jgi:hypothetical protein